jgi:ABC-type branched-subunit amino acid transport system permease subunit
MRSSDKRQKRKQILKAFTPQCLPQCLITSGDVILMALLGGIGTTFGPVVGAIVIVSLDEFLAESGLPIQTIIGSIFVLCILLFRDGIVGTLARWMKPTASKPVEAGKI